MRSGAIIFCKIETIIVGHTFGRTNRLHIISRHVSIIYQPAGVSIRALHRAINTIQGKLNIRQYLNTGFSIYRSGRIQIQPIVSARTYEEQYRTDK